ncbi:SprT family zinc-dependent metalloprotease [Planococcus sp. APC 3900]|uniref:M48 family metallopeptidase n=1 Tax=Planococcus sp. APC 3900 TaxID=3035191 RepID=UPI0025B31C5A|nr:SprT family zinc-dependent metalloprotease [Planococcus sp. APC 3900]MDN3436490.1 SprT family zinc-dependent metalloprotease [Planococcus sp. APC 3900]
MKNSFAFGNKEITYSVVESRKRKHLNIAVADGEVILTIPFATKPEVYEPLLRTKAPWILKQLTDYEELELNNGELQFRSGEKLPYLGRYYRLKVTKNSALSASLHFSKGRFEATVPEELSVDEQRAQLYPLYKQWIQEKGQSFAEKRIQRFIQRLGRAPSGVAVRSMEKRWGSCTPQQKILLNWRIFLAPVTMVDYVLAHEVAHLKEMNHTYVYWETLRMLIPDYEERKEWLRINGNQLYI